MNNIDKFEKLKELTLLRKELSREMIGRSLSIKSMFSSKDLLSLGKVLFKTYLRKKSR